jgi:hypothetical protein
VNEKRPPALKRWILSDALTPAIKAEASTQKRTNEPNEPSCENEISLE